MAHSNYQHTILIIQFDKRIVSRTWIDTPSVNDAVEELVQLYEDQVRAQCKNMQPGDQITYTFGELERFINNMDTACCLIMDAATKTYIPRDKDWLKLRVRIIDLDDGLLE